MKQAKNKSEKITSNTTSFSQCINCKSYNCLGVKLIIAISKSPEPPSKNLRSPSAKLLKFLYSVATVYGWKDFQSVKSA